MSWKTYKVLCALRALGEATAVEIAEAAGLAHYRQTVSPLLTEERQGHVERVGRGVWALTDSGRHHLNVCGFAPR